MAEIVTIGEILVEMMATRVGQTFREPGLFAGPYPSGAPAIFADQAARMGVASALIGCVGEDAFGTLNIERLRASGAEVGGIRQVAGAPTAVAFVTYREDGGRDFVFTLPGSAAAALGPDQLDPALFRGCRFFHVMGSSLFSPRMAEAVRRGVGLAKAAGARISFDPNIRKELLGLPEVEATIKQVLAKADVVLPSEADLAHFFPGLPEEEAARRLLDTGRAMVLVKRGARGSLYLDVARRIETRAFPVEEVDPTGAGDCFGATFMACLVRGVPLERALLLANAAGALAVGKRGPMEGNSTLAELEAFLAARGLG